MGVENMKKVCSKCGISKNIIEFHKCSNNKDGYKNICKKCRSLESKLRYEENKEKRKEQNKEYYRNNKDKCTKAPKAYREANKKRLKEKRREYQRKNRSHFNEYSKAQYHSKKGKAYRDANRHIILQKSKEFGNSLLTKDSFIYQKIKKYEDAITDCNDEKLIQIRCTYCGKYYNPKISEVQCRLKAINGTIKGESRLYCSDNCKKATSREVQPQLRQLVLERDAWKCQKCGKSVDEVQLHCHHILPLNESPIESADMDNCITLCKKCHKLVHKLPDCAYHELRCYNKQE
jgi:5-methylcytosine-specific restriction endonuclease McrA